MLRSKYTNDLVYSGTKLLTDKIDGSPLDAGKLVLSPTRTYAPIIHKIIETIGAKNINGMIHCSGGAQTVIDLATMKYRRNHGDNAGEWFHLEEDHL